MEKVNEIANLNFEKMNHQVINHRWRNSRKARLFELTELSVAVKWIYVNKKKCDT